MDARRWRTSLIYSDVLLATVIVLLLSPVQVTDASANAEPYSSLFSYLFGRGGSDVSRRSDPRYLRTEKSQSTLGSEFLGRKKRAYDAAAAADTDNMDRLVAKRVPGSEFLGKRAPGSEFLGKRGGGFRPYGAGGRWAAALAKRMGSEFLGKRAPGSEFLGKRAPGSEFLGKRVPGSEFLGKRAPGSEFLGKRSPEVPYRWWMTSDRDNYDDRLRELLAQT